MTQCCHLWFFGLPINYSSDVKICQSYITYILCIIKIECCCYIIMNLNNTLCSLHFSSGVTESFHRKSDKFLILKLFMSLVNFFVFFHYFYAFWSFKIQACKYYIRTLFKSFWHWCLIKTSVLTNEWDYFCFKICWKIKVSLFNFLQHRRKFRVKQHTATMRITWFRHSATIISK